MFIKDERERVRESRQQVAQKMCQFFRGNERLNAFQKLRGQNKQVGESAKGKHSQADISSLLLLPLPSTAAEAKPLSCQNDPRSNNAHLYCASSFYLEKERRDTAVDCVFTSLVIHVEGGQNLFAALPPSLLLSGADRDGIVSLHIPALSVTEPGDWCRIQNITTSSLIRYLVFSSYHLK